MSTSRGLARCALAFGLITITITSKAMAQACLPASEEAVRLVAGVRLDVADPIDIDSIGLQSVAATEVILIETDSVCAIARDAYNAIRQPTWGPTPASQVHVIQAGASRFVVIDPRAKFGEWMLHVVFDASWQHLTQYGG